MSAAPAWAEVVESDQPVHVEGSEPFTFQTSRRTVARFRIGRRDVELRVALAQVVRESGTRRGVPVVEVVDVARDEVVERFDLADLAPVLGELDEETLGIALTVAVQRR